MSKNSRTEKVRVTESADFGAYFLILAVVAVGALAYFSEDFGPRWAKVIEIVGAPFSLGLGFFAFDKGFEMLNDYKENKRKEDEEEEKTTSRTKKCKIKG